MPAATATCCASGRRRRRRPGSPSRGAGPTGQAAKGATPLRVRGRAQRDLDRLLGQDRGAGRRDQASRGASWPIPICFDVIRSLRGAHRAAGPRHGTSSQAAEQRWLDLAARQQAGDLSRRRASTCRTSGMRGNIRAAVVNMTNSSSHATDGGHVVALHQSAVSEPRSSARLASAARVIEERRAWRC